MIDFTFSSPTKLFFGKDYEKQVGNIIKSYGFRKVALIYGKSSIKKTGLYDVVVNSLKDNKIEYVDIAGVEPNPKLSFVINAISKLKNENIDLLLAVGGGSVIDTAKLISHAMYYQGNPFDFNLSIAKNDKVIPVGVILTIAAAGSELSNSCVISNDLETPFLKKGFNSESNRPLFAISNPVLTYSVSPYQTACGVVDIMMHTLERFMNAKDDCMLSENFAIGLLKTMLYYGKIVMEDPNNYEARAEIMLASSLSHNGLTGLAKSQIMRVHGLEHILSGFYDEVSHGAGLAILWPAWSVVALKNSPRAKKQFEILAKELFGLDDPLQGIIALKDFFKVINMPTSLNDLKLNKEIEIEKMALAYSNNKTKVVHDLIDLDYDRFVEIFNLAKEGNYVS